jgi:hypothetical protein
MLRWFLLIVWSLAISIPRKTCGPFERTLVMRKSKETPHTQTAASRSKKSAAGEKHESAPARARRAKNGSWLAEPDQRRHARDDTTPIPRPSTFHGREQYLATRELPPYNLNPKPPSSPQAKVPIVPAAEDLLPGRIDKSVLTISEPKRRRDKATRQTGRH